MAIAGSFVFVLAFVVFGLVFFRIARTMWRGPHGMIDDLMDRAEYMQSRMRDMQREQEPPDWICGHCDRRNAADAHECASCGAPVRVEH